MEGRVYQIKRHRTVSRNSCSVLVPCWNFLQMFCCLLNSRLLGTAATETTTSEVDSSKLLLYVDDWIRYAICSLHLYSKSAICHCHVVWSPYMDCTCTSMPLPCTDEKLSSQESTHPAAVSVCPSQHACSCICMPKSTFIQLYLHAQVNMAATG